MADTAPSLASKIQQLLTEAADELGGLEERRLKLIEERDLEIAKVRDKYADQVAVIDEELKMARRLQHALEPPQARAAETKKLRAAAPKKEWVPSQENLDAVMRCLRDDVNNVKPMAERMDVSSTTVKYALDHLRERGLVRMKGKDRNIKGNPVVYALTPQGVQATAELNGVPANV